MSPVKRLIVGLHQPGAPAAIVRDATKYINTSAVMKLVGSRRRVRFELVICSVLVRCACLFVISCVSVIICKSSCLNLSKLE